MQLRYEKSIILYLRFKGKLTRTIVSWSPRALKSIGTFIRVPRHFLPQEIPGSFESTRKRFACIGNCSRRVPRHPLVWITDRRRSVSPLYQVSNFTCSLHVTSDYFSRLTPPQHPSSISQVNLLFNLPMAFVKWSLITRPNACFVNERRYLPTLQLTNYIQLWYSIKYIIYYIYINIYIYMYIYT